MYFKFNSIYKIISNTIKVFHINKKKYRQLNTISKPLKGIQKLAAIFIHKDYLAKYFENNISNAKYKVLEMFHVYKNQFSI